MSEQIKKGKKYKVLSDATNKVWDVCSFYTHGDDVKFDDNTTATNLKTKVNTLETKVDDCFQSVSDGKALVASAITDKGVTTASDAEFAVMANNISKISQGAGSGSEYLYYDEDLKQVMAYSISLGKFIPIKNLENLPIESIYLFVGGAFYNTNIGTIKMSSVGVNGEYILNNASATGVGLWCSGLNGYTKVRFGACGKNTIQYGTCNATSSLPSVINSGAGRVSFKSELLTSEEKIYEIDVNNYGFFIGIGSGELNSLLKITFIEVLNE